jgi:diguanylate cyclase (GGDEF)-like protein
VKSPTFKRDRPTIGILTGRAILEGTPGDNYRIAVIRGIQSAARSQGCNLLLSWGIRPIIDINRVYHAWPIISPESDFIPVGPWNTDGLIVFTPLGDRDGSVYLQGLKAEGFPILFVATGEEGPTISVDNAKGIHQAMTHLVEHGHRRIAFIAGIPADPGDSAIRLQAYQAEMAANGLEADPRLVEWGWHYYREGYKAMQRLLASDSKITAVVASNDNSAVGAMQAIRDAGLRVPADVAVIGFDDQPIGMAQVPSLTSVHVPLTLIGEMALVTMMDHLTQNAPLRSIQITPRLIQRQSCGCLPQVVSSAFDGGLRNKTNASPFDSRPASLQEMRQQIVDEMLDALPAEYRFRGGDGIRVACRSLVDALYQSLKERTPTYFQKAFIDRIVELEKTDGSLEPWQELITVLRREMNSLPLKWEDNDTRHLADDLLHQARVVVGESAQRNVFRQEYLRVLHTRNLNDLTASLSAALTESQALEFLKGRLEKVGIQHIRVMFFQAEEEDPVAWSLVLDPDADAPPQRFLSRQFPPPGFYPSDELLNVVLLPLVYQNEVFGYVALEANDLDSCAVITIQLAATIKVARLHARVIELSLTDALTGLHNRRYFDLFLKNEIDRSRRFSRNLAVIMADIDYFKEYNDLFGHLAGDIALQQVAHCLAESIRNADVVARVGGDEFAFILPETDRSGALKLIKKIRKSISRVVGLERQLTMSFGISELSEKALTAQSLLDLADQALYRAKRKSRNRPRDYLD